METELHVNFESLATREQRESSEITTEDGPDADWASHVSTRREIRSNRRKHTISGSSHNGRESGYYSIAGSSFLGSPPNVTPITRRPSRASLEGVPCVDFLHLLTAGPETCVLPAVDLILDYLQPEDLAKSACVSKEWHTIVTTTNANANRRRIEYLEQIQQLKQRVGQENWPIKRRCERGFEREVFHNVQNFPEIRQTRNERPNDESFVPLPTLSQDRAESGREVRERLHASPSTHSSDLATDRSKRKVVHSSASPSSSRSTKRVRLDSPAPVTRSQSSLLRKSYKSKASSSKMRLRRL